MGVDEPGVSVPPPSLGGPATPGPASVPVASGGAEPIPDFPGPDVLVGSHRESLVWTAITVLLAAVSVVLVPLILGPLAIISALITFSRGERFAVLVLALAVACMLTGVVLGALVLHHHHHSLISHIRFT